MTAIEQMEQRHALERRWEESGRTLKIQYFSPRNEDKSLGIWIDFIPESEKYFVAFMPTFLWREKPSETSAKVVRPLWEAMEKTDDPWVRVKNGKQYGWDFKLPKEQEWIRGSDAEPCWASSTDYRIVELPPIPAPKYRPWTGDEVPVGIVVRRKGATQRQLIISATDSYCYLPDAGRITYVELLSDFEQLDGAACGNPVLEKGELPR